MSNDTTTRTYARTDGSRTRLRDAINSGEYLAGTYLPSARDLAQKLKISKSSVHNILKLLQEEGLIQIYPGCGALVLENSQSRRQLHRIFVRPSDYGTYDLLPITSKLLQSTACSAERHNIEMMLSFSDSGRLTDEIIAHHINDVIQGVVYLECKNYQELIAPLLKAHIPCVIAADNQNHREAVRTFVDFRAVARQAVHYLIQHGHRKIGLISGSEKDFLYHEMSAGFRGALAEENLPIFPEWQLGNLKYDRDQTSEKQLYNLLKNRDLKDFPTAFFTVRDYRAQWLYRAAEQLNLRIPADISVVSYDNHSWPEAAAHGLTTWEEPFKEQGEQAIKMLIDWVNSGQVPQSVEFHSKLVERCSVIYR